MAARTAVLHKLPASPGLESVMLPMGWVTFTQAVRLLAPTVWEKVPAGQSVQLDAPAIEKVPSGQSVALMECSGQKEPAGQVTGAPDAQK